MIWVILMTFVSLADAQNQQWQTVSLSAINNIFFSATSAHLNSIKTAKSISDVAKICSGIASDLKATSGPFYNATSAQKDCVSYFNHRLSLQRYANYLFNHLAVNYLTRYKSAELKSDLWNQDRKCSNQLDVTYCKFLTDVESLIFGTNRAKFFEHSVNISKDYKAFSLNDYYNVFFYRPSWQISYSIADAADNCLYNFGQKWGFGSYASQFAG